MGVATTELTLRGNFWKVYVYVYCSGFTGMLESLYTRSTCRELLIQQVYSRILNNLGGNGDKACELARISLNYALNVCIWHNLWLSILLSLSEVVTDLHL